MKKGPVFPDSQCIYTVMWFITDDAMSENDVKSLFVAYSAIDEKSGSLLHHVAAAKADISTFHQADGGVTATLSVYLYTVSQKCANFGKL